jgi:hypothetical protein
MTALFILVECQARLPEGHGAAKVLAKAIIQPPRVSATVVTLVAEENPRHDALSFSGCIAVFFRLGLLRT